MSIDVSPDALAKIRVDLWMHQNRLMWGRLQTLAVLQAGALGAAYGLRLQFFTFVMCLIAAIATLALIHISSVDRAIRNKFADELRDLYGLSIRLDMGNEGDRRRYNEASYHSLEFVTSSFYMNLIFISVAVFDLISIPVLMSR